MKATKVLKEMLDLTKPEIIIIFDRIYSVPEKIRIEMAAARTGTNTATYSRLVNSDLVPEKLYTGPRGPIMAAADATVIVAYSKTFGANLHVINRAYALMDFAEARLPHIERL